MDDRAFVDLGDEPLTSAEAAFLSALRARLDGRLRPYCCELSADRLVLALDVDAPGVALVSVGLELRGDRLRGDRLGVHDRSFPPGPTPDGLVAVGEPDVLAARGAELLERVAGRAVVRHEWIHEGRVYAHCYLFEHSGERLAQMFRGDWAPPGRAESLAAEGHVRGRGWVQTSGLGAPDRVVPVPGVR